MAENSLESYHIPCLHQKTFGVLPPEETSDHDLTERYRRAGAGPTVDTNDPEVVRAQVAGRIRDIAARRDATMVDLRTMLLYEDSDPRGHNLHYPSFQWFQQDRKQQLKRPLKPTR